MFAEFGGVMSRERVELNHTTDFGFVFGRFYREAKSSMTIHCATQQAVIQNAAA
jgi:hypothetical protein